MKYIQFLTLSLMFATYGVYASDEPENTQSIEEFIQEQAQNFHNKYAEKFGNLDEQLSLKEKTDFFAIYMNKQLETCNKIKKLIEFKLNQINDLEEMKKYMETNSKFLYGCTNAEITVNWLNEKFKTTSNTSNEQESNLDQGQN